MLPWTTARKACVRYDKEQCLCDLAQLYHYNSSLGSVRMKRDLKTDLIPLLLPVKLCVFCVCVCVCVWILHTMLKLPIVNQQGHRASSASCLQRVMSMRTVIKKKAATIKTWAGLRRSSLSIGIRALLGHIFFSQCRCWVMRFHCGGERKKVNFLALILF